jgi:hypothetical protein
LTALFGGRPVYGKSGLFGKQRPAVT